MKLIEKIDEYLGEALQNHVVPGLNKAYFSKDDIVNKVIDFVDEGSKMGAKVWLGKLGKKDIYAVAFYSGDLGTEAKVKTFKSKDEAKSIFDKIKDNISYDDILKMMR